MRVTQQKPIPDADVPVVYVISCKDRTTCVCYTIKMRTVTVGYTLCELGLREPFREQDTTYRATNAEHANKHIRTKYSRKQLGEHACIQF